MICKEYFGTLDGGQESYTYTLKNKSGMWVKITNFGGAIIGMGVPDREGKITDILAGFDNLDTYRTAPGYLGALVGRVCNRIARGSFEFHGKTHNLFVNNGPNSLHGGRVGFSHRLWNVQEKDSDSPSLILTLLSPDGEENYPATLAITVTYTLTEENELSINYLGIPDAPTVCNMTNHAYFNLGGYASGKVFDHIVRINADCYLPTDETLIPTGEIRSVTNTPFDFRVPKPIGRDFYLHDPDLLIAGGYDHYLCFTEGATHTPVLRAEVYEPNSGRVMQVLSTAPGMQFYTGNFLLPEKPHLKGGYPQSPQMAFCMETSGMNDAVNHKNFQSIEVTPENPFVSTTIYRFSVR